MPVIIGSTTASIAAVVIAASIALPPRRRQSTPASVASECDEATTPRLLTAWLRPARQGLARGPRCSSRSRSLQLIRRGGGGRGRLLRLLDREQLDVEEQHG